MKSEDDATEIVQKARSDTEKTLQFARNEAGRLIPEERARARKINEDRLEGARRSALSEAQDIRKKRDLDAELIKKWHGAVLFCCQVLLSGRATGGSYVLSGKNE